MADLQWEQFTLGQNEEIQKIAAAAAKASALVDANAKLAQTTLETGKVLLMGLLNPQLLLLTAIADEIDRFVEDFKGTGFYILEVVPSGNEIIPKDFDLRIAPLFGCAITTGMGVINNDRYPVFQTPIKAIGYFQICHFSHFSCKFRMRFTIL